MPLEETESRPIDLLEEDTRCKAAVRAFTDNIIRRLALSPSEAEKLSTYDRSPKEGNLYLHFPFCFREAFSDVSLENMRTIAFSGVLWMSYMRAQDDAVDNRGNADPIFLFLRDLYLRESLKMLAKLFSSDSEFWELYNTYFDEYASAVLREHRNHSILEVSYDEDEFHIIAKGKATMAKYPIAALAILAGRDDKLAVLTNSLDCYYIGYQYWDDLVDWKEDLANSKCTLLLARALGRMTPETKTGSPDLLREKIGRVIYSSGLAQEHLARAWKWLERAHELSLTVGCKIWADCVQRHQKQTMTLAADLRSIMEKHRPDASAARS
jgi:hypothetical protein